jgi:hypothetical protein
MERARDCPAAAVGEDKGQIIRIKQWLTVLICQDEGDVLNRDPIGEIEPCTDAVLNIAEKLVTTPYLAFTLLNWKHRGPPR